MKLQRPRNLILFVLALLSLLVFAQSSASAIGYRVPDPADFNSSSNTTVPDNYDPDVWLEVAEGGLDATRSDIRFYMNTPGKIQIIDGKDGCGSPPDSGNLATTFTFSWYKPSTASWTAYATKTSSQLTCDTAVDIPAPPAACDAYKLNQISTVCLVEMNATTTATDGVNAFKVQLSTSTNGYATYFNGNSGDKFAMQDRTNNGNCDPSGACPDADFQLYFAPQCSISQADINGSNSYRTIRWFDDDRGGLEPASGIRVRVDRAPFGSTTWTNVDDFYAASGNAVSGSRVLAVGDVLIDHVYRVTWINVDRNNGIQFALPFDSIYSKVDCRPAYVDGLKVGIDQGAASGSDSKTERLPSGQDAGTTYPFADDEVRAYDSAGTYIHGINSNMFYFKDCSVSPNCNIEGQTYKGNTQLEARNGVTFKSVDTGGTANGTDWTNIGYTICDRTSPPPGGCNATFLLDRNNLRTTPVNLQPGHSYAIRWLYEKPVANSLTLKCASNGTVTATATYNDPDGATDGFLRYSGIATTRKNNPGGTWTGIPSNATVQLYVKDVPSNTDVLIDTQTRDCGPVPPCPVGSQNTKPNVTLPTAPLPVRSGATVSASAPSGSQKDPSAVWYHESAQNSYRIDDAYDQWGSGASPTTTAPSAAYPSGTKPQSGATHVTWTEPNFQATNTFTLNYNNYVTDYPYDLHQTTVLYTQKYNEQKYVADTSKPIYNCYSYGAGYDTTAKQCRYAATATPTCPAGQTPSGGRCYDSSGVNKGPTTTKYSCQGGTTPTTTHYCYYPVEITYPWKVSGSVVSLNAQGAYTGAQQLDQCLYRAVDLEDASSKADVVSVVPDEEDPNTVTYRGTVVGIFHRASGETTSNIQPRESNKAHVVVTAQPFYSSDPNATSGTAIPGCSISQPDLSFDRLQFEQTDTQVTADIYNRCTQNPSFSPPMQLGDYFCVRYTFTLPGNETDRGGKMYGSDVVLQKSKCDHPIVNEPYAHFFGGDVAAGGAFANGLAGCGTNSTAKITGFVKNPGAVQTRGMSTQFGALAEDTINGFGSASLRPSSPFPTGGNGLTFANIGNPGNVLGKLGMSPCISDYYYTNTLASKVDPATDGSAIDTSAKQAYFHTGNMKLPPLEIQDGASIAVYVRGNLSITGDIHFAGASGWSKIQDVPSLFIIVSGNIFIDSSVTELDGVYIAQPNGAGTGFIDTCANGSSWTSIASDNLLAACQSQLTVNGSFIAQHIKFHRAYASIRNSQGAETPAGGAQDCKQNGAAGGSRGPGEINFDCAAEIFHLGSEVYLGIPRIPQVGGPTSGKFDYITTVQPVL